MTKPGGMANVRCGVDEITEAIASDRRRFIKGVGMAVLTMHSLPLVAHASGTPPIDGQVTADNLVIHSTSGFVPHVHDLLIPCAVLETPPAQGVELTTTRALFHQHGVVLTREELIMVNRGETVTKKASSHLFVIALTGRQERSASGNVPRRTNDAS